MDQLIKQLVLQKMQELMNEPQKLKDWFESKRKEFDELPES